MDEIYNTLAVGLTAYTPGISELSWLVCLVTIVMLAVGWKLSEYVYHFIALAVRFCIAVAIAGFFAVVLVKWGPVWLGIRENIKAAL